MTNVGVELARFRVKQPTSEDVSVVYNPGALAPGMSIVLEVEVCVDEAGVVQDDVLIETEAEMFRIPISANVVSLEEFEEWQVCVYVCVCVYMYV